MSWGWGFKPYVSVATRRAQAIKEMERLRKKGLMVQPVNIEGRKIASTFWGQAWCTHLEKFSDYESRLPRGRTYVRNGSVCHLEIQQGNIVAKVQGSELYDVEIGIKHLSAAKWKSLKERCGGRVGSLLELLQGKFSTEVMTVVTDAENGLFPLPVEIDLDCSCPDWADMCKHVAAVLYGVGARLDAQPELLFRLRAVDHTELVGADAAAAIVSNATPTGHRVLDEGSLSDVFGIDLAPDRKFPKHSLTKDSKDSKDGARKGAGSRRLPAPKRKTSVPSKRATPAARQKLKTRRRKMAKK